MHIGKIIYNYRKDHKLSMDKFAEKSGLSKSYIAMLEKNLNPSTGKTITPTIDVIKKIANAMMIDFDDLFAIMDDDTIISVNTISQTSDEEIYQKLKMDYIKIPLYSSICCGNGGFNDDNILEYIPVPSKGLVSDKKYFGQYAEGKSMKEAGIGDGDLLVFEKVSKIDSGVIGCFCVDENKAMCKKYKEQNGIIILQPMNNDYEPIIIDPLNNNFRCIGKLKKVIKDFDWDD